MRRPVRIRWIGVRPSPILARLGYEGCGIVENGKFRDQVHRAVAINIDRGRRTHDPARPTDVIGRAWRPRFAGIGRVRPEQRAILARQSQKRRRPANGPDEVGRTVAIEIGRGLDQLTRSFFIAEMGQPAQRGDRVALGTPRPRGPRGVPDRLARRSITPNQSLAIPLDEVGLARPQHDSFGD